MFDGWVPREVTEHYALPDGPDGEPVLTGYSVVTRESEWDDETRQRALDLAEYEDNLCGCGCGRPATESWRENKYVVKTAKCYAGRAIEHVKRLDRAKHKDDPDSGWEDGLHYYAELADEKSAPGESETTTTKRLGVKRGH